MRGSVLSARRFVDLIRAERSLRRKASLLERVAFWRRGFLSQAPVIYDLSDPDDAADKYVSDYARYMLAVNINSDNRLLNNKFTCHFLVQGVLGDVNPLLFAVVRGGRLYPVQCPEPNVEKWLSKYLDSGNQVIAKPMTGAKGQGVRTFDRWDALSSWIRGTSAGLIYERLTQHSYAEDVFPDSLNTIRLVTMVDDHGPFIAASVHRFGTTESAPVDNWAAGGLCAAIDTRTGIIGEAVQHPRFTRWKLRWQKRHPDTNALIHGVQIPGWQELVDKVLSFAYKLRFLPYLAWDLASTDNGIRVVEINGNSDVDLLQIHGPLLENDRVRAFYKQYGIVQ